MSNILSRFIELVKLCVDDKSYNDFDTSRGTRTYYPNSYAGYAKSAFDAHINDGWGDSKELEKPKRGEHLSFCSVASSARLCFLDFYEKQRIGHLKLETPMPNDFCPQFPTKMDAIVLDICYECKCQEVVDGEKELLSISYQASKESILFKEFHIKDDGEYEIIKRKTKDEETGEYKEKDFLDFSCKDLNIDIDKQYYQLHINLKQMICHLIAMANSKLEHKPSVLQYVIYIPQLKLIDENKEIKQVYKELIDEFEKILDPQTKIQKFASLHGITIKEPVYKTVEDFNQVFDFKNIVMK